MAQGSKRFSMILNDTRDVHGEMGLRITQNIAQFYDDDPQRWTQFCTEALGPEDAQKVIEVLSGQVSEIEAAFGVSVTATSQMVNKEAEKQNFIGMLQITTQVYGQLVQTAMAMQQMPPGTPAYESAAAAYSGGVNLLQRLLERFDMQDSTAFIGNMATIASQLTGAGQQAGMAMPMPGVAMPMQPYPNAGGIDPYVATLMGLG
jgi:hypothetical protein